MHVHGRGYPLLAALILALGLALGPWSATQAGAQDGEVQANMEDVLLEDFIRFYSRYANRNVIYRSDQIPKIKFNIYSQEAISEPELYAIFNEVITNAGLAAVAKGDVLYVFPQAQAKTINDTFVPSYQSVRDQESELVTTVYQLDRDVNPADAAEQLKTLVSKVGRLQPIPEAQALLIQDTREYVDKILEVLHTVQNIRPDWGFDVIRLEEADAGKVVGVLAAMYGELVKQKKLATTPLLQPLDWSNAILFAGTPEQKQTLRDLLEKVDHVAEGETGLIRVYRLQSATAETLANVLQSLVEAQIKEEQDQEKGVKKVTSQSVFKVSADKDTNSIVVLGSKEVFESVEKIIEELDQPRDQVYVEALVIETTLNNAKDFGIEWMAGGANEDNIGQVGFLDADDTLIDYASPVIDEDSSLPNFGALPGGFSAGILGNLITYNGITFPTVSALVSFVKTVDEINILSTPQVITMDHSEAEVFVGENRPYLTGKETDEDGDTDFAYEYRDVGVKLTVTPHINAKNNLIMLDVEQEVKKVTETNEQFAPTTLNRYTKTSVQLADGATMVIGGLIQNDAERGKTGVPGLANIPVMGWLFKRETSSASKTTLMVFLTARIVRTMETVETITQGKMQDVEDFHRRSRSLFESEFDVFKDEEAEPEQESDGRIGTMRRMLEREAGLPSEGDDALEDAGNRTVPAQPADEPDGEVPAND